MSDAINENDLMELPILELLATDHLTIDQKFEVLIKRLFLRFDIRTKHIDVLEGAFEGWEPGDFYYFDQVIKAKFGVKNVQREIYIREVPISELSN